MGGGLPVDEENPRAGARGGAAPGVAAEEEAIASKRSGATGRPTSSATGPVAGGRGAKDGEDAEHKRRYGLAEDGEERFGTDERTVPPVIGETAIDRERRLAQEAGRHRREH
ncbi:hypothetical protein [Actinocrispum wychmicini]|uniref:hypothetical protein n=1 Tax=Actinocrispum wychmicini TaxID=1213861 RepID=UPI001050A5AD|nr:hypothetical protein [Actinocrispum wychmicini]